MCVSSESRNTRPFSSPAACLLLLLSPLPDPSILSWRFQLGLGVGAGRAPDGEVAALHDGTSTGAHGADIRSRPVALQQPVQPAAQRRSSQAGVGLRLLYCTQAHWQPQHRIQAVETLLHVGVPERASVQPQGVLWTRVERESKSSVQRSFWTSSGSRLQMILTAEQENFLLSKLFLNPSAPGERSDKRALESKRQKNNEQQQTITWRTQARKTSQTILYWHTHTHTHTDLLSQLSCIRIFIASVSSHTYTHTLRVTSVWISIFWGFSFDLFDLPQTCVCVCDTL